MRMLKWFFLLVLFGLLFGFAVKNVHVVDLYFFFGHEWSMPMVFVIGIAFTAGALLGVIATISSLLRQRYEISQLRRQLSRIDEQHAGESARTEP